MRGKHPLPREPSERLNELNFLKINQRLITTALKEITANI
jgi:hypothetical protein